MTIDWGTIAAITVAVMAVIGILIQFFKKEKPWKKIQTEHNIRLTALEIQTKTASEKIDQLKEMIDDHDHRDTKDFERIEGKIEKLTDLMINFLQNDTKIKPRSTRTKTKK